MLGCLERVPLSVGVLNEGGRSVARSPCKRRARGVRLTGEFFFLSGRVHRGFVESVPTNLLLRSCSSNCELCRDSCCERLERRDGPDCKKNQKSRLEKLMMRSVSLNSLFEGWMRGATSRFVFGTLKNVLPASESRCPCPVAPRADSGS